MTKQLSSAVRRSEISLTADTVRILLVDSDDLLAMEASGFQHDELAFEARSSAGAVDPVQLAEACEVVVVSIDLKGGAELIERIAREPDAPVVIALAALGAPGRTLEHTLTLAELHGAAIALPKPIDTSELALAALEALGRRGGLSPKLEKLADELQRAA